MGGVGNIMAIPFLNLFQTKMLNPSMCDQDVNNNL